MADNDEVTRAQQIIDASTDGTTTKVDVPVMAWASRILERERAVK